jgi:predicted nuclease of predicted toxin-antitoxin system
MKFLLDMGIPPRSAAHLKSLGHDTVHLREVGLHRLADVEILAKALQERRAVVTHDLDFTDLLAASGQELPTVVVFRVRDMRARNVNRFLDLLLNSHADALERGVVIVVQETRIRVRPLPIHRNRPEE